MRTLKLMAGALTLGVLALVLTSCGTSTAPLSFTLFVPGGVAAHATVQGSDGHVISTQAFNAGTQQVDLAGVPSDALVTVSMYAPNVNATNEKDYYNLTVPASIVAGHQVMLVEPISNAVNITVTFTCPAGATTVSWMGSEYRSGSSVSCSSGSFTFNPSSTSLQSDGTYSMVLIAYNGATPVDYATKLDQNISSGGFTVSAGDWAGSAPLTNTSEMDFPALPANESASMGLEAFVMHGGQPFDVQPSNPNASTSTAGTTSLSVSAPAVPVSGASYSIADNFDYTYSDTTGLTWDSESVRLHQVSALPIHEVTDTTGSSLWPTLNDAHWVNNGGSPTLTYQKNAGTSAATFAMADVFEVDNSASPVVARSWLYFGNPNATSGTFQYPDMPSSLSAYVPTPVATAAGTNYASLGYSDFEPVLISSGLIGLISGGAMGPIPLGLLLYGIIGPFGLPNTLNLQFAETNHITTSAVRQDRPYIALR